MLRCCQCYVFFRSFLIRWVDWQTFLLTGPSCHLLSLLFFHMLTHSIFHPPTHSRTYTLFHPLAHVLIISLRTFFSLSCRWLIDSVSHSFKSPSSFSLTFRHSRIYFPILSFIQSLARLLASFFTDSPTPSFSLIFTVLFTYFPSHLCIDYLCIDLVSRLVSRTLTHVRLSGIVLCINNSSLQTLTNRLTIH